jgi:5'-nucleotidase
LTERPLILVTNDDGVHSPGLRALAGALKGVGEVVVVAPDREMSACGHSLSLRSAVPAEVEPGFFALHGTPADCVDRALRGVLGRRPDLVLSGINLGANLADDIFYSGTVGGAREAIFNRLPAIAVSLAARTPTDFKLAAAFSVHLARVVLSRGLPERTLLNVNVPPGQPMRSVFTVQGKSDRLTIGPDVGVVSRNGHGDWKLDDDGRGLDEMSDLHAVRAGLISITPLQTDTTHHRTIERFRSWDIDRAE